MAKESEVKVNLFGGEYSVTKCNHSKLGEGFEIDFTQMYESPVELSYANMQVISDYFGTKDIDFDNEELLKVMFKKEFGKDLSDHDKEEILNFIKFKANK